MSKRRYIDTRTRETIFEPIHTMRDEAFKIVQHCDAILSLQKKSHGWTPYQRALILTQLKKASLLFGYEGALRARDHVMELIIEDAK